MKVLILRFSSFGDILQCLSVAGAIKRDAPKSTIHWATRLEFKELIESHPAVNKVWHLNRKGGMSELWSFSRKLKKEKFTHIYDAHNNLRSHFIMWFLLGVFKWKAFVKGVKWIQRPSERIKRFFLFSLRMNFYEQPWNGQRNFLKPLKVWNIQQHPPSLPQLFFTQKTKEKMKRLFDQEFFSSVQKPQSYQRPLRSLISLAPSASYPLKRWPLSYWKKLIHLLSEFSFIILGGSQDYFLRDFHTDNERLKSQKVKKKTQHNNKNKLASHTPSTKKTILNLTSRLSFIESAFMIRLSSLLITNDTGLMHVAEQTGTPCLALMGPTAFGFPSRPLSKVMEMNLKCKPCSPYGKGQCYNPYFQQCLREISPENVAQEARKMIQSCLLSQGSDGKG